MTRCRRRSEPSEVDRSATEHLNTESNRPRVQPNEYAVFNTQVDHKHKDTHRLFCATPF